MSRRLARENRVRGTATRMTDLVGDSFRFFLAFAEFPFRVVLGSGTNGPNGTTQQRRLDSFVARIHRLINVARAEGLDQDFLQQLHRVADHREEIERAIIVWLDLIEVLVQDAERRYGSVRGKGALKAVEVKETILFLLRRQHVKLPNVPDVLVPLVLDTAVDWAVEALVLILNRSGMWIDTTAAPPNLSTRFLMFIRLARMRLWNLILVIANPVFNLVARIYQALRPRNRISRELQNALDAVGREGLCSNPDQLARSSFDAIAWIGLHRQSLVAFVEVVTEGVKEAETFISLSGPEKKDYAHDLILAVLDELGFRQRSGLLFMIVDVMIGAAIEAAVHLFHKRSVFQHRRSFSPNSRSF